MALTAKQAFALSRKYTDNSIAGGGISAGKNCVISSIDDITGGHRINFEWTLDNGTVQTDYMDVMDGVKGDKGDTGNTGKGIKGVQVNEQDHLIITYTDDSTTDAGQILITAAVDSVNGKSGDVTLNATDVGALPDNTPIPAEQIQTDWNQSDDTKKDFLKNKPTIPAAQIQSDWNQSDNSKKDFIKNKPDVVVTSETSGLIKNDGTIDTTTYQEDITISNKKVII